jgi:hypothetical protein
MSSAVPLTQAVTAGDVDAVSAALAAGADANERNNGGQTALILAVIFGHTDLVHLLVKAGANPRLRDNLGLDAVEWAQRRGLNDIVDLFTGQTRVSEPQINTDEKSRKWLAGVKQRIQEQQARQEQAASQPPSLSEPASQPEAAAQPESVPQPNPVSQSESVPIPEPVAMSEQVVPAPEPVRLTEPKPAPETPSPARKRCPKCGAIYNSELVAYCAHHVVRLVDADEPAFLQQPPATANTPWLWLLLLATVSVAAFAGYMITTQLTGGGSVPDSQTTSAPQPPRGFLKGSPVVAGDLAGRSTNLPEAQCPIFESRPANASRIVHVHIKLDKTGKVYWARAEGGDEPMRTAATEAATNSTFSPDKLRGRETEGTITYTFAQ